MADDGEVNPKAFPLATGRLATAIADVVQEASNARLIKKGANEATKSLNRGIADLIVIAGDTNPIEIILHLPLLCEDKNVPYVFVPSKVNLGRASQVSRNVIALAILKSDHKGITAKVQGIKADVEKLLY